MEWEINSVWSTAFKRFWIRLLRHRASMYIKYKYVCVCDCVEGKMLVTIVMYSWWISSLFIIVQSAFLMYHFTHSYPSNTHWIQKNTYFKKFHIRRYREIKMLSLQYMYWNTYFLSNAFELFPFELMSICFLKEIHTQFEIQTHTHKQTHDHSQYQNCLILNHPFTYPTIHNPESWNPTGKKRP